MKSVIIYGLIMKQSIRYNVDRYNCIYCLWKFIYIETIEINNKKYMYISSLNKKNDTYRESIAIISVD